MTSAAVLSASAESPSALPIVCFSHLAWDEKLYQRPQQIMSRLAALGHPVYYFACIGHHKHKANPMAGPVPGAPGVFVYTLPYAPGVRRFAGLRRWLASLKVASTLARHCVRQPVLWFYHPLLFALGYAHADAAIVYDVMDHFPSFEQSGSDLYYEELTLLAEADIAFTGGRSLDRHIRSMVHDLYSDINPKSPTTSPRSSSLCEIHCFPSGIELSHFQKSLDESITVPSEIASLPTPRFGYFGAVDERLDWDLIRQLANFTQGSVILAGPQLRPPPTDLPGNVHLPGGIPYSNLPALLAGFDVCLIPFKTTPLVDYISPTKTPEYLAGGKPVVSTPIPDVISDYGDIVNVAAGGTAFVQACLEAAANPPAPKILSEQASRRSRTWDEIASEMDRLLSEKISRVKSPSHAAR